MAPKKGKGAVQQEQVNKVTKPRTELDEEFDRLAAEMEALRGREKKWMDRAEECADKAERFREAQEELSREHKERTQACKKISQDFQALVASGTEAPGTAASNKKPAKTKAAPASNPNETEEERQKRQQEWDRAVESLTQIFWRPRMPKKMSTTSEVSGMKGARPDAKKAPPSAGTSTRKEPSPEQEAAARSLATPDTSDSPARAVSGTPDGTKAGSRGATPATAAPGTPPPATPTLATDTHSSGTPMVPGEEVARPAGAEEVLLRPAGVDEALFQKVFDLRELRLQEEEADAVCLTKGDEYKVRREEIKKLDELNTYALNAVRQEIEALSHTLEDARVRKEEEDRLYAEAELKKESLETRPVSGASSLPAKQLPPKKAK
uniref:Uncharacterized protein n=1 Tax=Eutreptiella gymnastica TaxID=73025 RepID=A0A7S4FSQ0_9EUGL|eukprot:CAMPEP_0174306522 /NCGR_PEP_ID=MMETSP0810-20121108/508_1 /TAXON_ID=73025 ORGANISM="Eutreptiella gymnastica-like, Strain CCMP1594" /NCGR_SAMPLE_ID=MMETSP0810 /ASSEMBLY_ACC=CAM_ASM_000659 /LENGTH=379 /DNA_ID=CAMNT_0015413267 /DNA_START=80 /DNA_END=1219 /DNA_ORIENTATION=-